LLWALVVKLHPLNWACAQAVRWISDKEEIQENAIRAAHHHRKCVPGNIPTMEETLGTVYCQ
jgi:hypothetical protein